MRLIENSEDGLPIFSAEAKTIIQFNRIIMRDKDRKKEQATKELAFIHFWCIFDSRYDMYGNTKDKARRIADDLGLENWEPDQLIVDGINKYKDLIKTRSSRVVSKADDAIQKLEDFFENLDLLSNDNKTNAGALIIKPKDVQDFIKQLPEMVKAKQEAEKLVRKELEEQAGKVREDIGMFETGDFKMERDREVM